MCREDTKLNYIHTHTHLMFREGTKLNHTHTPRATFHQIKGMVRISVAEGIKAQGS